MKQPNLNKKNLWIMPFNTVLIYTIVGGFWIVLSDKALAMLVSDPALITSISIYKGWFYVIVTALILYFLMIQDFSTIHKLNRHLNEQNTELSANNEEINALYEELAASEETLHHNFDELQTIKQNLELQDLRYQLVLEASNEGFWDYWPQKKFFSMSPKCYELIGINQITMTPHELLKRVHPLERKLFPWFSNNNDLNFVKRESKSFDFRLINDEGVYRWFRINGLATLDENNFPIRFTGSLADIHDRIVQQERIEYYAFHDPSTGFYNRDYMSEKLHTYFLASATNDDPKLPFIVIQIAGFDRILGVHGKLLADIIHYQIGMLIKEAFYYTSNFSVLSMGRFGILVPHNDTSAELETSLIHSIKSLKESLKTPLLQNNIEIPIHLAIGAYMCHVNRDVSNIITHAEIACEEAEHNAWFEEIVWFTQRMQDDKNYLVQIENSLKRITVSNELYLVYQPQYRSLNRETLIGYEALLRWKHPALGMIRPDIFISLAEEVGEIITIGRFVIESTCQFLNAYQEMTGKTTRVAINASFKELMHKDYVSHLIKQIEFHHVHPSQISIEITETAISKYIDIVIDNLTQLRNNGFEIHLDDFGTGYSSLSHLGLLPVNVIKVDRSFITNLEVDDKMRKLTSLIIHMSHQLELTVIAEGVEKIEQYEILEKMGCDAYQGYLFDRPLEVQTILN